MSDNKILDGSQAGIEAHQPWPAKETSREREWKVQKWFNTVSDERGKFVCECRTREKADQIVAEHEAVRKLMALVKDPLAITAWKINQILSTLNPKGTDE
jgi:hypothetical protein